LELLGLRKKVKVPLTVSVGRRKRMLPVPPPVDLGRKVSDAPARSLREWFVAWLAP
jgi:hypothetical protein